MQTSSIAPSMMPQQMTPAVLELKDGQMIYGKVLKINSNQTAEISIGQHKITAALDAPIASGEKYWFQVQTSGDLTSLKVLPNNGGNQSIKEMSVLLLQHFSLPETKGSLSLAQFLVKNQIPFTKDQFVQVMQWLNNAGNQSKDMPLLKLMHDFSLPFSENVFRALSSFENGVPLQKHFFSLNNLLANPKTETEATVKALLMQFISTNAEKLGEQGLQKLVTNMLTSEGGVKGNISSILQNIGLLPKNENVNAALQQALKILHNDAVLVKNPAVKEVIQLLNQMKMNITTKPAELAIIQQLSRIVNEQAEASVNSTDNKMWQQLQRVVQQSAPFFSAASNASASDAMRQTVLQNISNAVMAYINSANSENPLQTSRFMQMLFQAGQPEGNYEIVRQAAANMLLLAAEGKQLPNLSKADQQLIQQIMQTEINDLKAPKTNVIANEIKQLIRQFGLGLEHYLANADKGTSLKEAELLTLKPQLLQLMNETQMPSVREQAEQLLHKITAQQILSQSSGPIQHFIAQFPLSFQKFQTEVTMQWSGRKDENGEIDPAFCRVLFYLQLENLKETVVDMVVQNRIMKINIINDHYQEMKEDAMPLIAQVKSNLGNIGYHVSAISFNPPYQKKTKTSPVSNSSFYEKTPYNGVDIKI